SVLLAAVLVGPVAVSGALVRPALPKAEALARDAAPLLEVTTAREAVTRFIPDTALSLRIGEHRASIEASDGGGAGSIPLPHGTLEKVRVARASRSEVELTADEPRLLDAVFAIELTMRNGRVFTTWIDDAGVRLDDALGRRFAALLPGGTSLLLLGSVLWTAIWLAMALPRQAQLRKQYQRTGAAPQAYERRALRSALWLLPAALASTLIGVWAVAR
ncbi:MAG: hypothetical protein ABW352_00035, partial [Polyangiales bacterium]